MPQHPGVPWIAFQPVGPSAVAIRCAACGASETTSRPGADEFTRRHAVHQSASRTHHGLGDVVAAAAAPVARLLGKAPCTPCEARRQALNQVAPAVPFFRRR